MTQTAAPKTFTREDLALMTDDEVAVVLADIRYRILDHAERVGKTELEESPLTWLSALFPAYVYASFGAHQSEFWSWLWAIEEARRPHPFVGIWSRGGAKSTSAELGCVALGARGRRRYGLYVCETQDQANDHVGTIGALLESDQVARMYPLLGERMVGKYNVARGWSRNRLRTASGFTIDAVGLDKSTRGVKIEEQRPDFMIFDDLDGTYDSAKTVDTKIGTITKQILPAGTDDCAILAIQNLIHPDSIFAQLADGRADFLTDRIVSGPVPAVEGLVTSETADGYRIIEGEPTWLGQDIAACQAFIDTYGITAFLGECQHEVEAPPGGMFDHLTFRHCTPGEVPDLVRTTVWVDPAVTDTDQSDSHACQCDGISADGTIFRLASWEHRATPVDALVKAITWAYQFESRTVGVETDQGGDTWQSVFREALARVLADHPEWAGRPPPVFTSDKASKVKREGHGISQPSKAGRAQRMLTDYETPAAGGIVHVVGTHDVLERALRRFPRTKPYDLVDASFWSWRDLRGHGGPAVSHGRQVAAATFATPQMARRSNGMAQARR